MAEDPTWWMRDDLEVEEILQFQLQLHKKISSISHVAVNLLVRKAYSLALFAPKRAGKCRAVYLSRKDSARAAYQGRSEASMILGCNTQFENHMCEYSISMNFPCLMHPNDCWCRTWTRRRLKTVGHQIDLWLITKRFPCDLNYFDKCLPIFLFHLLCQDPG